MFSGLHGMSRSDADLAQEALTQEGTYRFPSFSASDAVTLGLSLRKRFRASHRHAKGKGLVLSIQSIAGHTLFSCTVGDLGHFSGYADVGLDSWSCLEAMIEVVKRTGHSSFYVEKGMNALGKTPKQMPGLQGDVRVQGGVLAFPIWLENAPICPVAVIACYSGSSQDDHNLVVNSVRDYLNKLLRDGRAGASVTMPIPSIASVPPPRPESRSVSARHDYQNHRHHGQRPTSWQEWNLPEVTTAASEYTRPETPYDEHDD
ncbi:hypothetical protein D9758_001343 [Tetrapyrgos nigripes]|uniref:Uncharacterized protein n=1 Tax=Tetrapyrgos nigripes TaxID=182062 RepID=A0A8H5GS89_9AGAR|nr:hypothetical protein D9758_001343 [Tetrapyrgos nigripes]